MAGNKKITQLIELTDPDSNTWVEALDLNEVDPNLQNKKLNYINWVNPNSHIQNTDQFLDFGGSNQVSAASAAEAVLRMHDQDTDQYLDKGGSDEVTAYNASLVINTVPMLWWLTGDPTATGQMDIGDDSAGERVVLFNVRSFGLIDMADALLSVAQGRYLAISFPNGHWVAEMKTGFASVADWVQVVGITKSIDADFTGIGKLTII